MASILERNKNAKLPKKTLQDHAEDALYMEVTEEVRAQATYDFVKKYARPLIALAVIIVLSVVAYQLIHWHNARAKMASAAAYESAIMMMESGNPAAANEALVRAAKKSSGGMSDLALLSAAKIDIQTGDAMAGMAKLEQLAKSGATRDFRDLATLNLAVMRADEMSAKDFERFMAPLLSKRSPFYYTGLLLVAKKYLAVDDSGSAQIWLDKIISDSDAPSVVMVQAEMLR